MVLPLFLGHGLNDTGKAFGIRRISYAACFAGALIGLSMASEPSSGPAALEPASSKVPDLELEAVLPLALKQMEQERLAEKYSIRSAQFIAGKVRGWEFVLTERRPETKSEPSIWITADKKVELRSGR